MKLWNIKAWVDRYNSISIKYYANTRKEAIMKARMDRSRGHIFKSVSKVTASVVK